ncbi:hypothetical protein, partial [Serratia marcescens]|uniref:hypothetical protein n=1 Tax=Serratia marcescens TaxID=615 RepID=UPI0019553D56
FAGDWGARPTQRLHITSPSLCIPAECLEERIIIVPGEKRRLTHYDTCKSLPSIPPLRHFFTDKTLLIAPAPLR